MKYLHHVVICSALLVGCPVSADVVINEVAWMGSDVSTADEWIELYNTSGAEVDLTGWVLETEDGGVSVNLLGSVQSNGYFILERTDDTSVPGIAADGIYTGVLSNTSEVLLLLNATGSVIDRIDSGEGWANIGGSVENKETAQRTFGGWGTGQPTPRAINSANQDTEEVEDQEEGDDSPTTGSVKGSSTSSKGSSTEKKVEHFSLRIEQDKKPALVHTPVVLRANVLGMEKEPYRVWWNMGDGTRFEGKEVYHTYKYPGMYSVAVTVRIQGKELEDRVAISVVDPLVEVSVNYGITGTVVVVKNKTGYEIDLSSWSVVSGDLVYVIPHNSFILPNATLRFSSKNTGLGHARTVTLLYPSGVVASKSGRVASLVKTQVAYASTGSSSNNSEKIVVSNDVVSKEVVRPASGEVPTIPSNSSQNETWVWIALLLGIIVVAILAVVGLSMHGRSEEVIEIIEE